jgi:antitoxin component HigA of HigAB toxin-antitoxin module
MAILIMADVPNQTQEGYDGVLAMVEPLIKQAPGYPVEGGWKSIEVWESKAAATEFFAKYIAPNLPPGVKPKRTIQELYSLVRN